VADDLVLLEQHAAAASASLDFTTFISGAYDEYLFELIGLIPSVNTANPIMRMGTGVGPTWDAVGPYNWAHKRFLWNGEGVTGVTSATEIALAIALNTADPLWSFNGSLRLFNPSGVTYRLCSGKFSGRDNAAAAFLGTECIGAYLSSVPATGVRFAMSSGVISVGTIRAYGVTGPVVAGGGFRGEPGGGIW